MRRLLSLILPLMIAVAGTLALSAPVHAAAYGVQDNANFFSKETIAKAEDVIRKIRSGDNRDVLVVTFDTLSPDQQDELKSKGKARFYDDWVETIGKENSVSGVVILLVKDPGHLRVGVGNKTREHSFTLDDRDQLEARMLTALNGKQYDDALLTGVDFIKGRMRRSQSNAAAPLQNSPGSTNYPTSPIVTHSTGFPVGGFIYAGIAILGVVFLVMSIVNRSRGYGGGYGAPPPGGYPPGYSGGYPQGGGYYGGGGGGGGFGRGLLGGLLGGALGAWGYEKFNQGSSNQNYNPQNPGGGDFGNSSSDQTDTSFSSTGGDFGSSSNDSTSSGGGGGGDFGSSSDSGGGGSDFGGGGGGGDFGGGGDSGGGSSGGDF